jgi:hypothetical protein
VAIPQMDLGNGPLCASQPKEELNELSSSTFHALIFPASNRAPGAPKTHIDLKDFLYANQQCLEAQARQFRP